MRAPHVPVLLKEVLAVFEGRDIRWFFDGTLGAGGHAKALLEAHPEIEGYIGCDRDPAALSIAQETLKEWKGKVHAFHNAHANAQEVLREVGAECVQGVLIDAGVSSMQLDTAERGFSFQGEGPLDMRMNPAADVSAEQLVNRWGEAELERILRDFGEEPRARAIARAIVAARKKKPLKTTRDLVEAIKPVARGKKHFHPATLTFQALRIAVNDELGQLERGIQAGIESLCIGGRIAVISFHRLEDRIAKVSFRDKERRALKKGGEVGCLEILTDKPLEASEEEIRDNPRCRSAKLRAAEKVV